MTKSVSLTLQEGHYSALKNFLFQDDCESVAFIACTKSESLERIRLLSKRLFFIRTDECKERTPKRVTWPTELITPLMDEAEAEGLSLVKIHSHPGGYDNFSEWDDASDKALFPKLSDWVSHGNPHASTIMLPCGKVFGRVVDRDGNFSPLQSVNVATDSLPFWFTPERTAVDATAIRSIQAYGEGTYNMMKQLRIGVVGCSGTGSPLITALNQNHIGELVIVDPDHIEEVNMNRIASATLQDAINKVPKVVNQKSTIEARGLGTKVFAYQADIFSEEIILALSSCDIIFGCVDSIMGRHVLNKICSAFLVPYFDLGVRLDADGKGGINDINAALHFIKPTGDSLFTRNVYSGVQISDALMSYSDPDHFREMEKEGYVKGADVSAPAVGHINAVLSNLAVEELIARLHGYRIDPPENFAVRKIMFTDGDIINEPAEEGIACPYYSPVIARGDKSPLLNMEGYSQ